MGKQCGDLAVGEILAAFPKSQPTPLFFCTAVQFALSVAWLLLLAMGQLVLTN